MSDGPKHADPVFRRIRDEMNRQSNANPNTVCRRCDTGYAPEMRSCNSRLAAQQTNAKRHGFDAGL
jgi:hypothetical protein